MKTIQPVSVWFNGQEVQATVLSSNCSDDNLSNSATFNYQLIQVIPNPANPYIDYLLPIASGILYMTGATYQNWETNDYAYEWIAQQLNLIITGPYVPPAPPTTTSTTTEASTTSTTTVAPSTTSTTTTEP